MTYLNCTIQRISILYTLCKYNINRDLIFMQVFFFISKTIKNIAPSRYENFHSFKGMKYIPTDEYIFVMLGPYSMLLPVLIQRLNSNVYSGMYIFMRSLKF